MENNYTESKILQYIYDDLPPEEILEFEVELEQNFQLREEYNSLIRTLGLLDRASENPHPTSVDLILEYSNAKSSLKTSKQT